MTLITTTKDLKSLCTRLKKSEFITVDTEFIREKTYWPHLCLIQVCGEDDEPYAIDPLAEADTEAVPIAINRPPDRDAIVMNELTQMADRRPQEVANVLRAWLAENKAGARR